jgi:type II secretory pathway pseudopilin PulG
MPFVQFNCFRLRIVIAALGIALAAVALAAPREAHADVLEAQAQEQEQDASSAAIGATGANDTAALDDRVLASQRGTGLGLMTVAAAAQAGGGARSVTLWDELAPPAPAPLPVDTAHVAQSNAVSYFRK